MKNIHENSDVIVGKFGGNEALKDVSAIKRLPLIVDKEMTAQQCNIIVVSAIGQTTRKLDEVFQLYEMQQFNEAIEMLEKILREHEETCWELFSEEDNSAVDLIRKSIRSTAEYIRNNFPLYEERDRAKSKILSVGEVMSWHTVSSYLTHSGIKNLKLDSREVVRTFGHKCTDAVVDIPLTFQKIASTMPLESIPRFIVCQGFIGSKANSNTTTLGYEGSDYSASIYAAYFDGYLKYFKKYPYHDSDPDQNPNSKHLESVPIDVLAQDVSRLDKKKPILHRRTVGVMKEFELCGEIISYSNLDQRTKILL